MANIKEQSRLILNHPFFADSVEKAQDGDTSGFDRLLYEIMASVWERVALEASRCYGKNHRLNHMDIKRELRDLPPPTTLDIRLPIPSPKEKPQLIVPIKKVKLRLVNPMQLLIPFPETPIRHLRIA